MTRSAVASDLKKRILKPWVIDVTIRLKVSSDDSDDEEVDGNHSCTYHQTGCTSHQTGWTR